LGCGFGWLLSVSRWAGAATLGLVLDAFRSIPLIIQLILFFNLFPIIGFPVNPFVAGTFVLVFYTSALVAAVARGGIEAVPITTRRAGRSLGMTYWQDMRYVVWPIGLRAVMPAWAGVALGVLKDSALVSVLGYVELLRASQILITRTQEPFLILTVVGLFYFALSFPISRATARLESRWQQ
jgi:polar amino acid transport system permease protein